MPITTEEQTQAFISEHKEVFEDCWDQAIERGWENDVVFLWLVTGAPADPDINFTVMPREAAAKVFNDLGEDALADYQRDQLTRPSGIGSAWLFIVQEYGTMSMRVRRLVIRDGPPS